ncbi:MAG: hypothetical protein EA381_10115 [Planctomycetaceae bacterium]|nr:MAG: hypothetical protein EA381_10115 [Planctomycetaceae bacterium]
MKTKSALSILLLGFIAVSLALAVRKVAPKTESGSEATAAVQTSSVGPEALTTKLAATQFSAVYFHSPHRCPTCRKIESFSHDALSSEVDAGKLAWQTADYTSDVNASLVDQFKVFTSTVVLVETRDGNVVRWKNLEEVWDHTGEQSGFTAFIHQAWADFQVL